VTPSASTAGLIGPKAMARTARSIATAESTTPQAATPTNTGWAFQAPKKIMISPAKLASPGRPIEAIAATIR